METKLPSPLQIQENQVLKLEDEIRAEREKFQERLRPKLEELNYARAKLEGMREMVAFSQSNATATATSELSQQLTPKRRVQSVILSAPFTWPHLPKAISELPQVPKRRRPLSDKWQPFFHYIESKNGATIEELDAFAVSCMKTEKKLAREQLRYYHREQFISLDALTRKYYLTDLGRSIYDPTKGEVPSATNTEDLYFQPAPSTGDQS